MKSKASDFASMSAFSVYNQSKGSSPEISGSTKSRHKKRKNVEDETSGAIVSENINGESSAVKIVRKIPESKKSGKKKRKIVKNFKHKDSDVEVKEEIDGELNSIISVREIPESKKSGKKKRKIVKNFKHKDSNVEVKEEIDGELNSIISEPEPNFPESQETSCNGQNHPTHSLKKNIVSCGNFLAEKSFKWMISPMSAKKFFGDFWGKNYAYIPRNDETYWTYLYSCKDFDKILKNHKVEFGKDIDITEYIDGVRKTVEAEGIANRNSVWNFYQDKCTIRMKNPQAYHEKLYQLLSHLQEYFGSFMGVNMYLTPPDSQGFAPHYDDIEAFVLQVEGRKIWQVYAPRSEEEKLPRFSSPNFSQDEIGPPIFEMELKAGDMLYFPRGFIHQAKTVCDSHSLHLTISTHQNNTWGDLLQVMLPRALEIAITSDVDFRESLPKDYMNYVGLANEKEERPEREKFLKKIQKLSKKLLTYLPIDEGADIHAKDFIHSCLPPSFTPKEKNLSVHGNSYRWKNGVISTESIKLETRIRLLRKRIFRMVFEDDSVRLYHTLANSKEYKENEIKYVEADEELIPVVQFLLHSFPNFVKVSELPLEADNDKLLFASDMYNSGFLMTEEALKKKKIQE